MICFAQPASFSNFIYFIFKSRDKERKEHMKNVDLRERTANCGLSYLVVSTQIVIVNELIQHPRTKHIPLSRAPTVQVPFIKVSPTPTKGTNNPFGFEFWHEWVRYEQTTTYPLNFHKRDLGRIKYMQLYLYLGRTEKMFPINPQLKKK